ncbi:MAG: hypothetical protein ACRCY7_03310 [Cetobacterium sp.]|uniref:hypothetical protein n=1 Tax=Cetobacterium sp. TaxID=2071632 RepID=UPI003F407ED4
MTSIILEDLIKERLEKLLYDLVLPKPRDGNTKDLTGKIKVFSGFFPLTQPGKKNENIPGIAIKACGGKNEELVINFDIYVYSEKENGHREGLLIIEKIRREFFSDPVFEFAEFKKMTWDMLNVSGPNYEFGGLLYFNIPPIEIEERCI